MYETFAINNFRCFEEFRIGPLARINLIAGKNNVGKTVLLEALWLHLGPDIPELGLRMNRFRGLTVGDPKELFWDLFFKFDTSKVIELRANGDWGTEERALRIKLRERKTGEISLEEQPKRGAAEPTRTATVSAASDKDIVFEYTDEHDRVFTSAGWYVERKMSPGGLGELVMEGLEQRQERVPGRPLSVYIAARQRVTPQEDAERFGQIQIAGEEEEIVKVLRCVEPRLRALKTVSTRGTPLVYADVGLGRLLPVPLLGDGIARLFSLAVSFVIASNGALLIDEIENGLHYTILPKIWESLDHFAKKFKVQLFATTHSDECVRAAHQVFEESPDPDFRFHRLDRTDGKIRSLTYDREMLHTALESGLEVR